MSLLKSILRLVGRNFTLNEKRKLLLRLAYIPFLRNRFYSLEQMYWVRHTYDKFGRNQREQIFLSIARFAHINRPISGYYFEFGCHEANTIRQAWDTFHHLFDWHFVAFDSFEGLPDMDDFDKSDIFTPGNLCTSESNFINILKHHGIPRDRFSTVKGFYSDSLTDSLVSKLSPHKAAVIYIDCDLYSSTVSVLRFCTSFLQKGTVIVFDDWNCYYSDPRLGEQLAWQEFLDLNPHLKFSEFVSTAEGKSFICTKC